MRILIIALAAPLLLLAAACGGDSSAPDPTPAGREGEPLVSAQALIDSSNKAVGDATSMRSEFTITVRAGGQTMRFSGDMDLEFDPPRGRMTMDVLGDSVDFLIYGSRFYINRTGEWELVDLERLGTNAESFEKLFENRGMFDYSAFSLPGVEAVDRGVADRDGRATRHITMEMTADVFSEENPGVQLFDPSIVDDIKDAFRSGNGEVWIDEETGYPVEAGIEMVMKLQGLDYKTTMNMTFSDFNEDLDIPDEPTVGESAE